MTRWSLLPIAFGAVSLLTPILAGASAYDETYLVYKRTPGQEESAWHGQTTPGSNTTEMKKVAFTPYWVPFGSKSVDDTDAQVRYSPREDWTTEKCSNCIGSSIHSASRSTARVSYAFEGIGIDWYGTTSPSHGLAEVYIDGKHIQTVDLYSSSTHTQQLLFHTSYLKHGKHTLRIAVVGSHERKSTGSLVDIDGFVVQQSRATSKLPSRPASKVKQEGRMRKEHRRSAGMSGAWTGATKLAQTGQSGIAAMQLSVVDDKHAVIVDKVEHNLLTVNGHPAWGAVYDFTSSTVRPLDLQSNSFCAGGSFLSNGTLINVGGNPVTSDHTGSADFGDVNGLQAVRMFTPCDDDSCDIYENPDRIRMASARWYASVARVSDGSALIMGGAIKGGWINNV